MFRRFLLYGLLALCLSALVLDLPGFGQNVRQDGVASSRTGAPAPGASVTLCSQPAVQTSTGCTPTIALCSSLTDVGCTSPNPVTADGLGNYHFYVPSVSLPVTICFSGSALTTSCLVDQAFGGGSSAAAGLLATQNVTFSSTPTFTALNNGGTNFLITLTGNVTSSTFSRGTAPNGTLFSFQISEDAIGGHSFVWPSSTAGGCTIDTTSIAATTYTQLFSNLNGFLVAEGPCTVYVGGLGGRIIARCVSSNSSEDCLDIYNTSGVKIFFCNSLLCQSNIPLNIAGPTDLIMPQNGSALPAPPSGTCAFGSNGSSGSPSIAFYCFGMGAPVNLTSTASDYDASSPASITATAFGKGTTGSIAFNGSHNDSAGEFTLSPTGVVSTCGGPNACTAGTITFGTTHTAGYCGIQQDPSLGSGDLIPLYPVAGGGSLVFSIGTAPVITNHTYTYIYTCRFIG